MNVIINMYLKFYLYCFTRNIIKTANPDAVANWIKMTGEY
jgi:hypothetical protein